MAGGLGEAIAQTLLAGDPLRAIDGLATFAGFTLYSAPASSKEIHVAEEPDEPNDCVTVVPEGGQAPTEGSHGINPARRPAFTVRTRSALYDSAEANAFQAYRILDGFEGKANGVPIMKCIASTEPIPLGRDRESEGGRWVFSQTFNTITKRYDS